MTLEFENARVVQNLFGGDENLLREMESRFDVQITTRDGWIRVEGAGADKAEKVFRHLDEARKKGVSIQAHEFRYAMDILEKGKALAPLLDQRILCPPRKACIVPKTEGQGNYITAIAGHDITFGLGPAGTGKTYLAVAMAVQAFRQEKVSRIVLTRPAVEAGEALGFLPGDLREKISPYLRPLYDALNDMMEAEEVQRLVDKGIIEIAPLAYMRGRTLAKSFVILDEAQNTTTEQMFMFLTRLGLDTKCVVTGDTTQIDLPRNKRSGLLEAIEALAHVEGIAFHTFSSVDVVRHPLVRTIIEAYRSYRYTGTNSQ